MGLKENFSQAVKELTGNTKEDDKKRNAQVAGLKRALGDDQPYADSGRFAEGASRPYYRDQDADNGQGNNNRDNYRRENPPQDRMNGSSGDGRDYYDGSDDFDQGYSRPQDGNYREQDRYEDNQDRNYSQRPNDYNNDRGYRQSSYDNRGDNGGRPYDNEQPAYNDNRDRGRGDYNGNRASDNRQNDNVGRNYDDRRDNGYNDRRNAYDGRQDNGYNGSQRGSYDNRQDNGYNDQRDPYDDRQDGGYNNNQRGSYDNRQDGGYNNNQRNSYDRQDSNYGNQRGMGGDRETRNYNVRNFDNERAAENNRQRSSYIGNDRANQGPSYGRNYDNQRNTYPIGSVNAQRDYRDSSDNELTVISRNTIIDGNVRSFANMSIDGDIRGDVETTKDIDLNGRIIGDIICSNANMMVSQVQGNIQLKGDVEIGRDTLLIGDLNSGFAKINGKVKGNVEVTGKAEFKADAVVFGDISASTITVDDGAIIQGYVSTTFLNKEESDRIFPDAIDFET